MKTVRLFVALSLVLFISTPFTSAKEKGKKEQIEGEVTREIDSKEYTIEVNRAIPMQGSSKNLTSMYSLTIHQDSVISYLPYFGRAYSAPYGGGKGLNFKGVTSDYTLSYDKKGTAKIKFTTRTDEDRYTYNVQVFTNGSSTINVTPANKQSISFQGNLTIKKSEK